MIKLIQGDCLDKLKELEDNSVDSIVTDPPYGWSFMGKKWDYDVPSIEVWKEVLRVLKPGAHALVACGTRTQHRMAVNLEDAGFEIRDMVAWIYGSGFPKSLNVGKAVKALQKTGGSSPRNIRKSRMGIDYEPTGQIDYRKGRMFSSEINNDKHKEEIDNEWEGWGTALKPAMELWTLCRKPLEEKTVAENVLKWGVGGINIDGCRVNLSENDNDLARINKKDNGMFGVGNNNNNNAQQLKEKGLPPVGRFPANVIHDGSDEVVEMFPNQKSGTRKSSYNIGDDDGKMFNHGIYGKYQSKNYDDVPSSSGSASRFFYCAKASRSERNRGCEELEEKEAVKQFNEGMEGKLRSNGTVIKESIKHRNNHPTVKPVALMRYLCRLITPPKGIVLDPFMGSGSTGIAAELEGFNFIGIELDPEYFKIAEARINEAEILNVK